MLFHPQRLARSAQLVARAAGELVSCPASTPYPVASGLRSPTPLRNLFSSKSPAVQSRDVPQFSSSASLQVLHCGVSHTTTRQVLLGWLNSQTPKVLTAGEGYSLCGLQWGAGKQGGADGPGVAGGGR